MVKRSIAIALLVFLIFSLVGCGNNKPVFSSETEMEQWCGIGYGQAKCLSYEDIENQNNDMSIDDLNSIQYPCRVYKMKDVEKEFEYSVYAYFENENSNEETKISDFKDFYTNLFVSQNQSKFDEIEKNHNVLIEIKNDNTCLIQLEGGETNESKEVADKIYQMIKDFDTRQYWMRKSSLINVVINDELIGSYKYSGFVPKDNTESIAEDSTETNTESSTELSPEESSESE